MYIAGTAFVSPSPQYRFVNQNGPLFGVLMYIYAPVASTSYVVEVCDQIITSTGGTSVSITVKDAAGNTLLSGASSLTNYYLAAGWSIDFGAFTAAPTVTVIGL